MATNKAFGGQIIFDEKGFVRSGLRAGIFFTLFVLLAALFSSLAGGVWSMLGYPLVPDSAAFLIVFRSIGLVCALFAGWLCGRSLERVPFSALGVSFLPGWSRDVLIGLALGAAAITAAVVFAFFGGGFRLAFNDLSSPTAMLSTAVVSFAVFAVAAAFEEALCRGYLLQTFERSGLFLFGAAATSLLFASGHIGNPASGWLSFINTLIAGAWFALAYWKTGDLWLVTAMHLMWNWMQGAVFGVEVSGLTGMLSDPLLREADNGPEWLTGGSYGLEGGVACTAALIISMIVLYKLPLTRRNAAQITER